MERYVTRKQMQQIDALTIQEAGIPSLVLMERAALSVAEQIQKMVFPQDGRILSVCGCGNNGADGLAVARILALRGYQTEVLFAGDPGRATSEWTVQHQILKKLGIPCVGVSSLLLPAGSGHGGQDELEPVEGNRNRIYEYIKSEGTGLIVDAIFGIGLSRSVGGIYAALIEAVNESECPVVSVDIPSGVNADNGAVENIAVKADATITFGVRKTGQILYPGTEYCGQLQVAEIGFAPFALERADFRAQSCTLEDLKQRLGPRPQNSHKGTFGRILVIAGSPLMAGAAIFSARAAYRMGCGLVKIHTVEENRICMHQSVPEAILSVYNPQAYSMEQLEKDCDWADVIVCGPGMGQNPPADRILQYLFYHTRVPLVLDADALRVLAGHPDWYEALSRRMILTPHPGEMSALCGVSVKELEGDRLKQAESFAGKYGCICLLKGSRTVIADENQSLYINLSGCDAMATAGSGDVLTGILAGFLAEGLDPVEAAVFGALFHGKAGEKAARRLESRSVMASDLVESIVEVWKDLLGSTC